MPTDDDLPWTTSRCNRLLRPLSSKLAKLRKHDQIQTSIAETRVASTAFATKHTPQKTTNFTRPAQKPRGFDKAFDPDWRPGANAGGAKKTYGGRRGRRPGVGRGNANTGEASRPGEVAFTPFVSRISGQAQSSPVAHPTPLRRHHKTRGPLAAEVDAHLSKGLPVDLQKLAQGVAEAYANILQATAAPESKRWNGTRSLMSACLRRLPAYIALEEHFAEVDKLDHDEEDRDIANDIYEHLEAQFEQRAGQGWRPFKQVVRAHATSLLCEAITNKVLGMETLTLLVAHCTNVSAWDEAESLLLAYFPNLEAISMPINPKANLFDTHKLPYLGLARKFVDRTGRHRFLFVLLEHLIVLEMLPLEWLATESMRPLWDRMVRTISESDHRALAQVLSFLETIMIASTGLPRTEPVVDDLLPIPERRGIVPSSREDLRQALNTTFSSLLTVLSSIALVNAKQSGDAVASISDRSAWSLDSMVVILNSYKDMESKLESLDAATADIETFAQRALWIIFTSFLMALERPRTASKTIQLEPSTLIKSLNRIVSIYSSFGLNVAAILATLPSLISSISRGCGRIWKDDGFNQLRSTTTSMISLSGCPLPHNLWTLKRIALESATEFAQNSNLREHMAYARDIEKSMQKEGRVVIIASPLKNQSPSAGGGFRWEEGIGEWVACTPFPRPRPKVVLRKSDHVSDGLPTPGPSEDDTAMNFDVEEIVQGQTTQRYVLDSEDENGAFYSSPVKQAPRVASIAPSKKMRASSPRVVIPLKAVIATPPESPEINVEMEQAVVANNENRQPDRNERRRLRRSRTELQALTSKLRTQRSRTSLDGGLRKVSRPSYTEVLLGNETDSKGESDMSSASDVSLDEPCLDRKQRKSATMLSKTCNETQSSRGSLRSRMRKTSRPSYTELLPDSDTDSVQSDISVAQPSLSSRQAQAPAPQSRKSSLGKRAEPESEDDSDDLCDVIDVRPVKCRRVSGRIIVKTKTPWWMVPGAVVQDNEGEMSEDELSFV